MKTFEELLRAWQVAEACSDRAGLQSLLAEDFTGDGAFGRVLRKAEWLNRTPIETTFEAEYSHTHDHIAVALGALRQCAGTKRCTVVAVRTNKTWQLVNVQLDYQPPTQDHSATWSMSQPSAQATLTGMSNQMPTPDPALKQLDRFVGTWAMHGRTLDSDKDNVTGKTTFEWLPGGFFLQQRVEITFVDFGFTVQGVEIIGYDAATRTFPSTVYPSMAGMPIPYVWSIDGDELTITTELLGATFKGRWSDDGASFGGGWRPNPGREGPGNIAYDIAGSRATESR